MPRSITGAYLALVTALVGVVGVAFAASWFSTRVGDDPVLRLTLAARPLVLSQKIAKDLLLLSQARGAERELRVRAVDSAAHVIEATLEAFERGGSVPLDLDDARAIVVERLPSDHERAALAALRVRWGPYREDLAQVLSGADDGRVLGTLLDANGALMRAADDLAGAVQRAAQERDTHTLWLNGALFVVAALLGALALVTLRRGVLEPIAALGAAAQQASRGALDEPVAAPATRELVELALGIERLRITLRALVHEPIAGEHDDGLGPP